MGGWAEAVQNGGDIMAKNVVRVNVGQTLAWPKACAICLEPSTEEHRTVFQGWQGVLLVPYCKDCYERVRRYESWRDGTFMIAVLFGILGAIAALIGRGVTEGWAELLHIGESTVLAGGGLLIFFGLSYALMWLLLLPARVIFHSKLSNPGVKLLKRKKEEVTVRLKFANAEYGQRFMQENGLA